MIRGRHDQRAFPFFAPPLQLPRRLLVLVGADLHQINTNTEAFAINGRLGRLLLVGGRLFHHLCFSHFVASRQNHRTNPLTSRPHFVLHVRPLVCDQTPCVPSRPSRRPTTQIYTWCN